MPSQNTKKCFEVNVAQFYWFSNSVLASRCRWSGGPGAAGVRAVALAGARTSLLKILGILMIHSKASYES